MLLPAIGIFVGGRGQRMGGAAKGNLSFEGRTILERSLEACRQAAERVSPGALPCIYLVGESAPYAAAGLPHLSDEPPGIGPMGGLRALLRAAARHGTAAVALAGDQPFLTAELLARLYREAEGAAALAPRQGVRWEPLFARYRPEPTLAAIDAVMARNESSLQSIFAVLGPRATLLELSSAEWQTLRDWDRPDDMLRDLTR
jgi:molybdopterin-guanine dinucleotide biosynthesis protein A